MDEQDFLDFLIALGEEFCESLSPVVGRNNIVPQDGYEVFLRAFHRDPSPQLLASLSESQIEWLRSNCEEHFECQGITTEQVRTVVSHTLFRWPADDA